MQSQTYHGACTVVQEHLMRHLDRKHFEVHVALNREGQGDHSEMSAYKHISALPSTLFRVTSFGPTIMEKSPQQVLAALPKGVAAIPSLAGLARYVRKHRIDIIHGTEKPRDAFYAVLLGKLTGAKSVVHLHVKWDTWLSPLVKWSIRNADAVIGVSPFVADSAIANGGCKPECVHVLLNSIDTAGWDPSVDGSAIRAQYGIPANAPVIGIVARLFKWKGHTELVRALDLVRDRVPDVKLMIVGEDDPRGSVERTLYSVELHQLITQLRLDEHVVFTGFRTDVPQVMAALDVFAMPSFEEPFGVVYLEAMAMRKPVVALESGGAVCSIRDGENGYLVPVGSIETLTDRLVTLLQDSALRARMGNRGREMVEQQFSARHMSAEAERIYRRIVRRDAIPASHAARPGHTAARQR
jgi:glycosyltransferase involved in cell wall biosynthesis